MDIINDLLDKKPKVIYIFGHENKCISTSHSSNDNASCIFYIRNA